MPPGDPFTSSNPMPPRRAGGVEDAHDWDGVKAAIERTHADRHDAIVEPFIEGSDVEVPVITIKGEPQILPMMIFRQADPAHLRTYYEKTRSGRPEPEILARPLRSARSGRPYRRTYPQGMGENNRPFDYGRFEFRVNEATGEIQFLELNLNCNLWSQKVFGRAALLAGWTQEQLIETLLAESLARHGLL